MFPLQETCRVLADIPSGVLPGRMRVGHELPPVAFGRFLFYVLVVFVPSAETVVCSFGAPESRRELGGAGGRLSA